MADHATHWRRLAGDGLIYDGPCILKAVIFWPDVAADYVDIYDGRDTTSGEKFCRIEADVDQTIGFDWGAGILFGRGIYVDGIDAAVETTIGFIPC